MLFQEGINRKQRLRNKWLEAGDRNTRFFFHAIASARHHVNRIYAIVANGKLWEKKIDIEREVVYLFQKLHTGENRLRPCMFQ